MLDCTDQSAAHRWSARLHHAAVLTVFCISLLAALLLAGPAREVSHVLTLWFKGEGGLSSSNLADLYLVKFKLTPSCVDVTDLVLEHEGGSAEDLACMVSMVC